MRNLFNNLNANDVIRVNEIKAGIIWIFELNGMLVCNKNIKFSPYDNYNNEKNEILDLLAAYVLIYGGPICCKDDLKSLSLKDGLFRKKMYFDYLVLIKSIINKESYNLKYYGFSDAVTFISSKYLCI